MLEQQKEITLDYKSDLEFGTEESLQIQKTKGQNQVPNIKYKEIWS